MSVQPLLDEFNEVVQTKIFHEIHYSHEMSILNCA